jgi:hypothetical protein
MNKFLTTITTAARKVGQFIKRNAAKAAAVVTAGSIALGAQVAKADYAIMSSDGSGNISFTPGGLVTPIITGVVAAVTAGAALVLIGVGVRWVYRAIKMSK